MVQKLLAGGAKEANQKQTAQAVKHATVYKTFKNTRPNERCFALYGAMPKN